MEDIQKKVTANLSQHLTFDLFVNELNEWWPEDYTWSQKALISIKINGYPNGLCTETGPGGFRCDWGRVTEIDKGKLINFRWQIGPNREPVPDEKRSSNVTIRFTSAGMNETLISLRHSEFKNHGIGWKEYQEALNSEQGWDFILNAFIGFLESRRVKETFAR